MATQSDKNEAQPRSDVSTKAEAQQHKLNAWEKFIEPVAIGSLPIILNDVLSDPNKLKNWRRVLIDARDILNAANL